MRDLYASHETGLQVVFSEVERYALSQEEVFAGTPGSLTRRAKSSGSVFYSRQYYDGSGKKREVYVSGPEGSPVADEKALALNNRIAEAAGAVASIRLLGRSGYTIADAKAQATLATLHNLGFFGAGGVLVGSHAFGALLNKLGVRAAPYATEDIDIARRESLALPKLTRPFIDVLKDSGIEFVAVPGLPSSKPGTSYKEKGRSRFHVDLLVPSRTKAFPVVPIPELKAHAQALPYLGYLLGDTHVTALIAREGVAAIRVPSAERFALHKLMVSQLRTTRDAKADRDLSQAAILLAVLADRHPGAIEDAAAALPRSARRYLKRASMALRSHLWPTYVRAWEALGSVTAR
jgi:hypothetical protein